MLQRDLAGEYVCELCLDEGDKLKRVGVRCDSGVLFLGEELLLSDRTVASPQSGDRAALQTEGPRFSPCHFPIGLGKIFVGNSGVALPVYVNSTDLGGPTS